MAAAPIALLLAVWRSIVGEKQARANQRQADTAQRSLVNERYQKGAEMLGHSVLSVRLGGIFALESLARDYPEDYHIQIVELFCAFVRNPTADKQLLLYFEDEDIQEKFPPRLRDDVQSIMTAIGRRSVEQMVAEAERDYRLDFRAAHLVRLELQDPNLTGALLQAADLSHAAIRGNGTNAYLKGVSFRGAILNDARFSFVDLSESVFGNAKLHGAMLQNVVLSGVRFNSGRFSGGPATGLTQAQLYAAWASHDNPPLLDGVLDSETGKPLEWKAS